MVTSLVNMQLHMKEKFREWRRVLQIARKPTKDEFTSSAKICALGIVLIGAIGFGIFLAFIVMGV